MMKALSIPALALTALLPLAAAAEPAPGAAGGAPPPEMRAQFERTRGEAKAAAFAVLGVAHRAQVQAIVDRVNAGTLTDPLDAAKQIDAILTPDEVKAVLAEREKFGEAMHHNGRMNASPAVASPSAAPVMHATGGDAGHFLLRVSVSADKMHALMKAAHDASAGASH